MSKVIEILMNEHKEIIKFVDKLRLMCLEFINNNKIDTEEFKKSVHFIKTFADERHHQKEEQLLFKSMVEYIGVKADKKRARELDQRACEINTELTPLYQKGIGQNIAIAAGVSTLFVGFCAAAWKKFSK